MTTQEQLAQWQAASYSKGSYLVVSMEPAGHSDIPGPDTVMKIFKEGDQPTVNLKQTVEGKVNGDRVKLIGSISVTNLELLNEPEPPIEAGLIVASHKLVISSLKNCRNIPLPGTVLEATSKSNYKLARTPRRVH